MEIREVADVTAAIAVILGGCALPTTDPDD
jgi:hypothetical protein